MVVESSDSLLGVLLAAVGATALGVQYLCVRLGTRDGNVIGVVLVSLLCNVAIIVPFVPVLYPISYSQLFTPVSIASFAIAGISGSLVARLFMFMSIEAIGASERRRSSH